MTDHRDAITARYVLEFHEAFDLPREPMPTVHVSDALADLRVNLLQEEVGEFVEATQRRDLVAIADALADIVYVAYGTAITYGIHLDAVIREVHRANMSKLDENGRPVLREDGKVMKSSRYQPPDVGKVLARQHRDAITGEFVTDEYAEANPDTAVSESPCAECERLRGVNHAQKIAIDGYREEVERLQADQPIVRTVGDLTPRHVGRRVRIGSSDPGVLVELGADIEDAYVAVGTYPAHILPLDTPCEVLP